MVNKYYSKKIKKDYQRQNSQNPFFLRKKGGKRTGLLKWLVLLGISGLFFLIWFFLSSSFWRLQNLKIDGLTRISGLEIEKIIWDQAGKSRWLIFKQSNIFLFNKSEATGKIIADYNLAASAINKKWPHTLEIKVKERPYAFIFQEGNDFFHASADAYIIKEQAVSEEDKKKYFILENKNTSSLIGIKNKINIKSDYLNFILDLNQRLSAYPELAVEKFIIDQEFNMVTVKFVGGPSVYFNTRGGAGSAADQINNLLLVKREKIKDNFSRTNYIDLRYGDRIFINPDFH